MALLFVDGKMNIHRIAGLATYVVLEKNFVKSGGFAKSAGVVLVLMWAAVPVSAGLAEFQQAF